MVKNKRRGFILIELLIGMILTALMVLTISKASFISNSIAGFAIFGDDIQAQVTIKEMLFQDIKAADAVETKDRSSMSIYKNAEAILYQIRDGELLRNNECLHGGISGSFDMINNTVEIFIKGADFDIGLNIQGGAQ